MLHDATGRGFNFGRAPERVVSLVPSLTETLFELGVGESVVGVTKFCVFPPTIDVTRVGGTKNPDVEAIRRLEPDLVYMNLEENLEKHARQIEAFAPVFVTEPKTIQDVVELLGMMGEIHAQQARALALITELRNELTSSPQELFTFACAIWKSPWMWCGGDTYVANLVTAAGGMNVFQESSRYPSVDVDSVAAMKPNVIFLPDEPYAFTAEDAAELRAGTGARVIGPFPGDLFTWHGARTIAGLRFLRETLAPAHVAR